ncbi:MAG: lytic transglycosylase domain-containing protein [Blastocatellia bacterium]|nr:lytic transglycosylase domain-containing protein [Blastocatellia bacterium]
MKRRAAIIILILILTAAGGGLATWHYWTHRYDDLIVTVARKHNLDPALVKAVIYEESFFNPRARSSQNAVGLMQVTPVAAREWMASTRSVTLGEAIAKISDEPSEGREPEFEEALANPSVSLHAGCWYMNSLLTRYRGETDSLAFALAAYNAGPSNVDRWASGKSSSRLSREEFLARIEFPATRSYVQNIIRRYDHYKKDPRLKFER